MAFRSNPVVLETTDTEVYEMQAGIEGAVVLGIFEKSGNARTFGLKFYKQSLDETFVISTAAAITANAQMKLPIPLSMEPGDQIIMSASAEDSVVVLPTITQSAEGGVTPGLDPRGDYNAGTTYAKNAVVRVDEDGASYISMQNNNTGNTPASSPSFWMVLLLDGTPGTPGEMTGPESSTTNAIARFADTSGSEVKNSGVTINDSNVLSGVSNRTGADTNFVSGTAGSNGEFISWNGDGDAVGSGKTVASAADISGAVANRLLDTGLIDDASAPLQLTDAATIAIDWAARVNFWVTPTATRTLGLPSNGIPGTWRTLTVHNGGAFTLNPHASYRLPAGEAPEIASGSGAITHLAIYCDKDGNFHLMPSGLQMEVA